MNQKTNGGAAFPLTSTREDFTGMTLRDYFAAKAMAAFLEKTLEDAAAQGENHGEFMASIAKIAFFMADAMLAERAQ